jgi:hypothetical protein
MIDCSSDLIPGTGSLISELIERLNGGESFDNPKLTEVADRHFNGSRAKGTYTPRDAYDAMEAAVNKYLLEGKASDLLRMDGKQALLNRCACDLQ